MTVTPMGSRSLSASLSGLIVRASPNPMNNAPAAMKKGMLGIVFTNAEYAVPIMTGPTRWAEASTIPAVNVY
jgi:hypothetical protein